MMKIIIMALLFATLMIIFGCNNNAKPNKNTQAETVEYQKMTAQQANEMMNNGEPYLLLDVRSEMEFNERRIDGAVLIPHDKIRKRATAELPDKDMLILIYCRSGNRSATATRELIDIGYRNVYDFGGIIDWNYETVSGVGN